MEWNFYINFLYVVANVIGFQSQLQHLDRLQHAVGHVSISPIFLDSYITVTLEDKDGITS